MRKLAYKVVALDDVIALVNPSTRLAVDFETHGFYGKICLAQFMQEDWDEALLVPNPDVFKLAQLLKTQPWMAHSVNYEIHTMQRQLAGALGNKASGWVPVNVDCTLLLSRLAFFTKKEHSLDDCYSYVFKSCIYKAHGLDKRVMQKADWRKLDDAKLKYAAIDVFYLFDLYRAVAHCKEDVSYNIDKLATLHIAKLQKGGLSINMDKAYERLTENNATIKEFNLPINVNSYQQVRPYIGETTSDDDALALFEINGNERAGKVRTVRKLTKQNSFINSYIENQQNGKLFGLYSFTTRSGRGNCRELNLQQLPRPFKSFFEPPKGRIRVMSDYSQLELRMACAMANETKMAELFRSGVDLHSFTGDKMSASRQIGKTCNFNLIYGGSANMLQSILMADAGTILPIEEVRSIKRKWHSLWPNMTHWQEQMSAVHRKGGVVSTLLGRKMSPNLYTDAMNLPVQGSSAEVAKLALHYQVRKLEHAELIDKVEFSNFVHDDFHWECADDPSVYMQVAEIVGSSMLEAWQEVTQYAKIPDLPMPISVEVGYNWGALASGVEKPVYVFEI